MWKRGLGRIGNQLQGVYRMRIDNRKKGEEKVSERITKTKTLEWKVCTAKICRMAVEETTDGWGLKIPFQIMLNLLAQVAKRAIELDDEKLNKLMLRLSLYSIANPEDPEYNPKFVEAYLKHGKMESLKSE